MAANVTVKDNTEVEADLTDETLNPDSLGAPANVARDKRNVFITLEIENVDITPEQIFDCISTYLGETVVLGNATDTEGSVTTDVLVQSPKEFSNKGVYVFNVGPAS
jgi:hypothetical protein